MNLARNLEFFRIEGVSEGNINLRKQPGLENLKQNC